MILIFTLNSELSPCSAFFSFTSCPESSGLHDSMQLKRLRTFCGCSASQVQPLRRHHQGTLHSLCKEAESAADISTIVYIIQDCSGARQNCTHHTIHLKISGKESKQKYLPAGVRRSNILLVGEA